MVKKKKRSFMSKLFSRRILLLIQFIVSIIFLGCIYILKMLPMKYYLILCGIIFLLWMLSSLLIKSGIKKKKRENKYAANNEMYCRWVLDGKKVPLQKVMQLLFPHRLCPS